MARQEQELPSKNLLHSESQLELGVGAGYQATEADTLPATRVSSPSRDAWRRFKRNWAAMTSLTVLLALILMAVFAPFMHTMNPFAQDYGTLDAAPNAHHWFGTDGVGRDLYSRLIFGLRPPFVVGIVGTAITVLLGTLIGVAAGFLGGVTDGLLSRFTDLIFAFPGFLLTLITVSLFGPALDPYFGGAGRLVLLTVVFALVSWPPLMRFTRSLTLGLREQQFVEAARTCGSTRSQIVKRHLLPNMWGLILVQASFIVVAVITNATILSILGLGIAPPNADLGQMLFDGVQRLDYSPWEVIFPSIALTMIILAFTFLGDGLRDAVDPRMHS